MRLIRTTSAALMLVSASAVANASITYNYAEAYASNSATGSQIGVHSDDDQDFSANPGSAMVFSAMSGVEVLEPGYDILANTSATVALSGSVISGQTTLSRDWAVGQGESFNASSNAEVTVEFSLSQGTTFELMTNHMTDGPVMAGMFFSILDLNANTIVYSFGGSNTAPSPFQDTGFLAAGDYQLHHSLSHSGSGFMGVGTRNMSMDFTFIVPTPGTAAVFGLFSVAVVRRRRR